MTYLVFVETTTKVYKGRIDCMRICSRELFFVVRGCAVLIVFNMSFKSNLMMLGVLLGLSLCCSLASTDEPVYRMCVPRKFYEDCLNLLKDPSEAGIKMECVAGRDRIDCLDKINRREADILASEPEDMYVAYHTKNEDFRVVSEIRTKDDKDAEFRYEGIILVKKNSKITSLKELRGAKSCHTGFGRNVGYKIPITKLKNLQLLKVSLDAEVTATERELKALSEFFSESCLVGTYSPYPETDRLLKKKYSNLCALCEKPDQCNYPDFYSGYDGAIRCLDKGKGEVAFTKVQFVKKYFGLIPGITAEGRPADFEYLCEDGTRRPVTGPACSWAQRPWMGYISNADAVNGEEKLHSLQTRLEKFFENGLHAENKEAAKHLLIDENAVYLSKPKAVEPKEYLERAGYRDVIERDGSMIHKVRMCVQTEVELSKCNSLRRAAYSRDIRPEIECVQEKDCLLAVKQKTADITAVRANNYKDARNNNLKPIVFESFEDVNVYVAVVEPTLNKDNIKHLPIHYEARSERARLAAALLNKRRGLNACQTTPSSETNLMIVHASELEKYKDKQLLCPNLEKKPVTEMKTCNFEAYLPVAIFIREKTSPVEQETLKHLLISVSQKFGRQGKLSDVFQLFGEYQKGAENVIFDDDALEFTVELSSDQVNESVFNELKCES